VEERLYGYQDEHRFSKQEFKFTLQLYARRHSEVVADLKLTQGHPLAFLAFTRQLFRLLVALEQQRQ
jgi:hypothetical protein